MLGIDRRVMDRIVDFVIVHPERYESLERYRSKGGEFRELAKRLVPDGWKVAEGPGPWCEVHPPRPQVPDAGFKIHLSTAHERASEMLAAVVPILVEEGVSFKVLVDEQILDFGNSTFWGRGACGKFIAIYPADVEQLKRLMARLHEATKDFRGPYILSDKRYKDSQVLFYRYGGFMKAQRVNAFGEPVALLRTADGRLLPDERLPYFALPEGMDDPFPDTEEEEDELVLNGRYKATDALGTSSKGGVYRCLDLQTNTEVVVKEARPLVNRGRKVPHDAIDCLKNEYHVLRRLEGTGVAPRPIELFQEWEHSFLAMEQAAGMPLAAYYSRWRANILLVASPTADQVRTYCEEFLALARKLIAGARTIHERGVVIQDVSPRNILFDPEQGTVTFIDFEAAYIAQGDGESLFIPIYTPGFGEARGMERLPTFTDDFRALSRVLGELLYPVTSFFAIAPERRAPLLAHFARERGVPEAFVRLTLGLGEQPEKVDVLLAEAERSIEGITAAEPIPPLLGDDELRKIVGAIGSYIVDQIQRGDDPLDLPSDYRRSMTNPLSVAYGASGTALFLKRTSGEVPPVFLDALVREASKISDDRYAPGLYIGSSGVAWTLLELGMREEAEALMATAQRSPILFENADMFYGAAGWGLANLFFLAQLGDEKYLRNAVDAFDHIKPQLERDKGGYFYKNTDAVYHGLAHGAAGIGYFLLRLYRATGQEEHLEVARGLLDFELACAEEEKPGYVQVRRSVGDRLVYPYWRIGGAGVGAVALRFHAALGDERYLDVARKIARNIEGNYTVFPTNFAGMSGLGSFFVDMYRRTEEASYLVEARRFADRVMLFALEKPSGIAFPGEELLRISTDYGTGSAGTGMFLHRIVAGGGLPYLDF
ncbi:membrane protein [Sorangium cellulosum]|uniref:Membrane protein n=1 Tax=Sorangium cellulosum TaxID=56 RepID=A0A2L0EJT9_SORCE|nr:class III lanthionine synthetase LanKC [Sorangium cellulosum]AUX39549.1 membrane protein [Sorangium cellulosum]